MKNNNGLVINNSESYEFDISSTTAKQISFSSKGIDFANITKGRKITGIAAFCDSTITKSPSGKTPVTAANLKNAFLTLAKKDGTGQSISRVPLVLMEPTLFGKYEVETEPFELDTTQSYIEFGDPSTLTVGHTIVIMFLYENK